MFPLLSTRLMQQHSILVLKAERIYAVSNNNLKLFNIKWKDCKLSFRVSQSRDDPKIKSPLFHSFQTSDPFFLIIPNQPIGFPANS